MAAVLKKKNNDKTNTSGKLFFFFKEFKSGGDSAYERGGDVRRKFWIKPLKETDLGVAQAFFDP